MVWKATFYFEGVEKSNSGNSKWNVENCCLVFYEGGKLKGSLNLVDQPKRTLEGTWKLSGRELDVTWRLFYGKRVKRVYKGTLIANRGFMKKGDVLYGTWGDGSFEYKLK